MKTSLKKLTSVFLAVLLVLSIFSVMGAAAVDTGKTSTGDEVDFTPTIHHSDLSGKDEYKFWITNNKGWGTVKVYAWNDSGAVTSEWPGWDMTEKVTNGYGEEVVAIYIPTDATGCIVNGGEGGGQTENITDFSQNYWVTDEVIKGDYDQDMYKVQTWGDPVPPTEEWTEEYIPGENTVYLNPGDFAGDGEWYAYTWSSGAGEWKSGTESNGVYEFNDISDNVIFASASGYPEADWGNCAAQTDDLYATNGATYVISDQRPADGEAGEMRPHYIGEWTDPVPVTDPETEPETQEPTEEVTQPETQEQINTQPETQEQINTQPETQAPTEEQVEPGHGLDITTSLNKVTTGQINAKKDAKVTVTFNMQAPMLLEDGQGTLYYDSSKLTLDEFKLPNVTAGLTTNKKIDNEAKFNFMGVDSDTESGLTDFKEAKLFVTATFTVKAEGSTTVNLDIEELDGYENGSQVAYYTFGKAAPEAASITESLSKPNVVVVGGETQAPTQGGQPDTQAPTQGGQPDTQAPTQGGQPDTQAQPTNPVATKTYKYIPKAEDIASGKNFKITIQDTNGQFHTYDLSPTGEIVDGQQVYAAQIPADVTPAVINYQVFQGPTYVSQVSKSASDVADGSVVKYDGTIAGQGATQPSSNSGNKSGGTKITKKANTMTVKALKKTVKVKKLKKKAQKVKVLNIKNAKGKVTVKITKAKKSIKKYLKITKKGVLKIKKWKKAKKGTYKIKVKVKAAGKKVGNIQYNAKTVTKTIKLKVK